MSVLVRTVPVLTSPHCYLSDWFVCVRCVSLFTLLLDRGISLSNSTLHRVSKPSKERYTRAHLKSSRRNPSCSTSVSCSPATCLPFPLRWLLHSPRTPRWLDVPHCLVFSPFVSIAAEKYRKLMFSLLLYYSWASVHLPVESQRLLTGLRLVRSGWNRPNFGV